MSGSGLLLCKLTLNPHFAGRRPDADIVHY